MFGFLKAKTPSHPLDGGDPWKGRLAFAAIVLVVCFYAMQLIINLQTLWLLVFGAVVVAVILRALADPIQRWTLIKDALAVFASLLIVVLLIAGVLFLFGTQIAQQVASLSAVLPQGWDQVQAYIQAQPYGAQLLEQIQHLGDRAGHHHRRTRSDERRLHVR